MNFGLKLNSKPDRADDARDRHEPRLRKDERDIAVLTGQLPPESDELFDVSEYRLATWITGPGR
jgi:hypothetical protein